MKKLINIEAELKKKKTKKQKNELLRKKRVFPHISQILLS